ncbi:MAG: hypothetical protein L6420_08550 [Elusimicrobia bacterium]|nr:hypothetical protein [Elusimicrobiota bacterium]
MNEKRVLSQKPSAFSGLCQSCRFAGSCKLRNKHNKTVFQCEEFELAETLNKKSESKKTNHNIFKDKKTDTGLCKNCAKRKDCIYKNSASVIWHCEEYE